MRFGDAYGSTDRERLERAWALAIGQPECDRGTSWVDAGGDSIAMLQLQLHLERAFRRKLPFDCLEPWMRVADLEKLLRMDSAPAPSALPCVHLLPGMLGDEPRLATFRRSLAGQCIFHVLPVPDIGDRAGLLRSVPAMGRRAAQDIDRHQPAGPLLIGGYSLGGCIAFEAARALIDAGRDIALLAMLDTPTGASATGDGPLHGRSTLDLRSIKHWLKLWLYSNYAVRNTLWRFAGRLSVKRGTAMRREILSFLKEHARNTWRPRGFDVPAFVVISAEFAPITQTLWRQLFPRARPLMVPGKHLDIFDASGAARLVAEFEQALRHASGHAVRRASGPQ